MKLTIGSKLLAAFVFVTIFVAISSSVSFYYMKKVNTSYSLLIDRQVSILSTTKDIQVLVLQQTNDLRGYLLTDDISFLSSLQSSNVLLSQRVSQTELLVVEQESHSMVQDLARMNLRFQQQFERLLDNYGEQQDKQAALSFFKKEVLPIGKQLGPLAASISERQQLLLDNGIAGNTKTVSWANRITTYMSVIAFVMTLLVGYFISRHITGNLSRVTKVIAGITPDFNASAGLPRIQIRSQDEIGEIARSFNDMASVVDKYSAQERDKTWLETNIAELVTMYQGIHDLETLAQRLIAKLTPLAGASYGVFYIRRQYSSKESKLHRLASYAYHDGSVGKDSFWFGEGLVGQAALDNQTILMTGVPDTYISIVSGIGTASPSSIMIVPIDFDGQVVAVIELATLTSFAPLQQALLQQVLSHLGVTINSIAGRMQIERLLQDAQALTEELQTQSEELQLQQEELKGINEKLEEQYRNSELKTLELEKIRLELEEKATQLTLSSQYKSEFLANMSHELRTPLNSLLILSDILANNAEGNLTSGQVKYANTIYQSGNDLLLLINDILDLSKVESGTIHLHLDEVSLHSICEYAQAQFSPVARQKGLPFHTRLDSDLPAALYTDEQRLLQIVKNLLANAFKFTAHGHVTLRIHRATESMLQKDAEKRALPLSSAIAFSITDTGIGISTNKQELIFQAFQQADGTTNRKYGGTGLGLSISRNMADLLGGFIIVESVEGHGSTFSLLLPEHYGSKAAESPFLMNEAAVALGEASAGNAERQNVSEDKRSSVSTALIDDMELAHAVDLTGKTILIVDDDMRNIFAITTALESMGMNVVFAENGKEGIARLQHNPTIDLVLMDIMLPEMDGYDAMRTIRQLPEHRALPIIALTAKAMKDDRDKCMDAGASDYISKPVNVDRLYSLIQVWLNR